MSGWSPKISENGAKPSKLNINVLETKKMVKAYLKRPNLKYGLFARH